MENSNFFALFLPLSRFYFFYCMTDYCNIMRRNINTYININVSIFISISSVSFTVLLFICATYIKPFYMLDYFISIKYATMVRSKDSIKIS